MRPPYLKKNDRVAIIATARNFSAPDLAEGIKTLQKWGLQVVQGTHLYRKDFLFAGSDKERLDDLQRMLDDKSIKAIFCARGGYGTSRILDQVSFKNFSRHPKWIIGFSDVTILHCRIQRLGIESVHGIMPLQFSQPGTESAKKSLKETLFGISPDYQIRSHSLNRTGTAKGLLTGGNLSILCSAIGTSSDFDTRNKLLFIEETDEYLYRLDRMMVHLKRAGKLKQLSGLIIGHMTAMKDNDQPFGKNAYEIIADAVKEYDYPVCYNFPAGHESKNMALILGREATLKVEKKKSALKFINESNN